MLEVNYTSKFERDVKALVRIQRDIAPLKEVVGLVAEDTERSKAILRQRHNMHTLKSTWSGSNECHVTNAGGWLVILKTGNGLVIFLRTGFHNELFR